LTGSGLADLWLHEVFGVTGPVTLAWIGINAPRVLGLDFSTPLDPTATAHDPEAESATDSGFLTTLPAELGHDIVYLKSELHYLRVVTTRGSTLVLFNLRDAIAAMPSGSGLQPHRSYWIALSHTQRLVRQGSSWRIELNSGDTVPVSRRQLSTVKQTLDQCQTPVNSA
jgi:hypothetical protein